MMFTAWQKTYSLAIVHMVRSLISIDQRLLGHSLSMQHYIPLGFITPLNS
jgi:hypothetical protein